MKPRRATPARSRWTTLLVAWLLVVAPAVGAVAPSAGLFTTVDEGIRLDRMLDGAYDRQFLAVDPEGIALDGGLRYTHWLRLVVDPGDLREGILRFDPVPADRITLYRSTGSSLPEEQTLRFFAPGEADALLGAGDGFRVSVDRPGPLVLYLAVSTRADVVMAPSFLPVDEAHQGDRRLSSLQAAVASALLVLTLGALALYVALRESAYLHFVGFGASLLVLLLAADGRLYAWPGLSALAWWGPLGLAALTFAHAALLLGFAQHFLGVSRLDASLGRGLDISRYVLFGLAVLCLGNVQALVQPMLSIADLAWALVVLVALALGLFGWQRGQPVARAWTLAGLLLAGGVLLRPLLRFGAIEPGFWPVWGVQPVLAVAAFLLSIALADRVMEFRKQRDRARLAKEQTDASLMVEQRRRELVDGLREQLRNAPPGDLEWIAMRRLLSVVSVLLPQGAAAIVAQGWREVDILLAEPGEAKARVSRLLAARGGNIRGLCRGRTPVQVKLEAGEGEGEQAAQYAVVPLRVAKPGWGAVLVERQAWEEFRQDELQLVAEFAQLAVGAADEVAGEVERRRRTDIDALTGALNRRAADVALQDLFHHAIDQRLPLSVVVAGIDHFKTLNERHGTAFGDDCLRQVADLVRRQLQPEDQLARHGGDSFLVLLPGRQPDQARQIAERLLELVRRMALRSEAGPAKLTLSIGVAARTGSEDEPGELVQRAERAVDIAKRSGRNQVQLAVAYGGYRDEETPPDDLIL